MPATYTPIRYPGGKTKIYPLVKEIINENDLTGSTYCEAFAGGAGLAMKLLLKRDVPRVIINDFDRAVFCMWNLIVNDSEGLCSYIDEVAVGIDTWERCRDVYRHADDYDDAELGRAAFFLNRTNVSGILDGGVIGGMDQAGNYSIDARFGKEGLKSKIVDIGKRRADIEVHMLDAEDFVDMLGERDEKLFAYFDPPYVKKGPGLYHSSFDESKHRALARKIKSCAFPWFATYDDDGLIDEIYGDCIKDTIVLGYSAHHAGLGKERLIMSSGMAYQGS